MPEHPDFDQIALQLVMQSARSRDRISAQAQVAIIEQLRQVWNARGAADMDAVADFRVKGLHSPETDRDAIIDLLRHLDR